MAFQLVPKDDKFFELLEEASSNVQRAAVAFRDLVGNWSNPKEGIQRLRDIEHDGDRMTHEIMDKLNRTFITPIDREDIHALASRLDDVIDVIHATADRMVLYRIDHTSPILIKMADVIVQSTDMIGKAIKSLQDMSRSRRTLDYCIEINRLENEGDVHLKTALEELFAGGKDVLEIIKWKEVYEQTEYATDKCEDIANTIESIVVKNA